MPSHRLEKLQAQRKELGDLLDNLAEGDPSRKDVQALLSELDRMLNRSGPRVKPVRPRKVTVEPDSSVLVATVPKSANSEIRISVKVWEGRQVVDLRLYSRGKPTPRGAAFDPGDLEAVMAGLLSARAMLPR